MTAAETIVFLVFAAGSAVDVQVLLKQFLFVFPARPLLQQEFRLYFLQGLLLQCQMSIYVRVYSK